MSCLGASFSDPSQWYICSVGVVPCCPREPRDANPGKTSKTLHPSECMVGVVFPLYPNPFKFTARGSLCFVVIIALPIATPSEFRNSASYALGDFTNCM